MTKCTICHGIEILAYNHNDIAYDSDGEGIKEHSTYEGNQYYIENDSSYCPKCDGYLGVAPNHDEWNVYEHASHLVQFYENNAEFDDSQVYEFLLSVDPKIVDFVDPDEYDQIDPDKVLKWCKRVIKLEKNQTKNKSLAKGVNILRTMWCGWLYPNDISYARYHPDWDNKCVCTYCRRWKKQSEHDKAITKGELIPYVGCQMGNTK